MKVNVNNKVLVPFDYSEFCGKSVEYALTLFEAKQIVIIHVAHQPSSASPGVIWDRVSEDTIRENCTKSFAEFCKKHGLPDNLKFVVAIGNPAQEISRFANKELVDLILISSHGRKGIARWFLGSVAERVARLAACPVLIYKPEEVINHRKRRLAEMDAMVRSMFDPDPA